MISLIRQAKNVTVAIIFFSFLACQKEKDNPPEEVLGDANAANALTSGPLAYKDSVFFLLSTPDNYAKPIRKPATIGYFMAIPEGLDINATTGRININKSEGGLKYRVYYVSTANNQPLDSTIITISGIDYPDSVFELKNPTGKTFLNPVYYGRPGSPSPCSLNGQGNCQFDEGHNDDQGENDDEGDSVNHLVINSSNGSIDLDSSYLMGVFGSSDPENGATKDFTLYYRLNDASKNALNKITIRLYHYKKLADIPSWLTDEIQKRKENYESISGQISSNGLIASNLILTYPKRPPLIIIVSGL